MNYNQFYPIVDIFGKVDDLGNKIHSRLIYNLGKEEQAVWISIVNDLIQGFNDEKLRHFAFDKKSSIAIEKLIKARTKENFKTWMKVVLKFFKAIRFLLKREIREGRQLSQKKITKNIISQIKKQPFFLKDDILKLKKEKDKFEIHYICPSKSPEYNCRFKLWRDTEFKFVIYRDKSLFVWDYINVDKSYRGKGFGSKIVKSVESIVSRYGIRRFSVEYPNRYYWRYKFGYVIPYNLCIGKKGYSLEGYKQL